METVIITGGIGSGKSRVCAYLASRGVPVYDSDARTKSLYERHPDLVDRMEEALGVPLRDAQGQLDRGLLAELIFRDSRKCALVEGLVYPAVLEDFTVWKGQQDPAGWGYGPVPFVVLESAVILSKPAFAGVGDKVVWVEAGAALRAARAAARDGVPEEQVRLRMAQQPEDRSRVDQMLVNEGSLEELPAEVDRVFATLYQK
ncbi:MAG: dephospho-CoA kinase [Bacteroidales bacterium]|nr:dephospho-CoA kinase [Bacteroidales bacterium]